MREIFTSESVTEGHPDKVADRISDAILDAIISEDENARVACETALSTGLALIIGEISTSSYVDIQKIVRKTLEEIGYNRGKYGFDSENCAVITAINEQSPDIAQGVNDAYESREEGKEEHSTGAGDQGMMFGYATNETEELMPLPISLAHKLTRKLTEVRKSGKIPYLRPDGKAQVSIEYDNGVPARVDTVVVSSQHDENIDIDELREDITREVINPVLGELKDEETKIFINPTGRFVIGGPKGDAGLTGRKIIVDTYGGMGRHGGGAFSGKDPTKVDRSGAYAARWIAKNIVAAGLADKAEVQVAYAIGVAEPVSIHVDTFGTGKVEDEVIAEAVEDVFDLRPEAIINQLDLKKPIYKDLSAYGHFGRDDLDLTWERTDKAEQLKERVEKNK